MESAEGADQAQSQHQPQPESGSAGTAAPPTKTEDPPSKCPEPGDPSPDTSAPSTGPSAGLAVASPPATMSTPTEAVEPTPEPPQSLPTTTHTEAMKPPLTAAPLEPSSSPDTTPVSAELPATEPPTAGSAGPTSSSNQQPTAQSPTPEQPVQPSVEAPSQPAVIPSSEPQPPSPAEPIVAPTTVASNQPNLDASSKAPVDSVPSQEPPVKAPASEPPVASTKPSSQQSSAQAPASQQPPAQTPTSEPAARPPATAAPSDPSPTIATSTTDSTTIKPPATEPAKPASSSPVEVPTAKPQSTLESPTTAGEPSSSLTNATKGPPLQIPTIGGESSSGLPTTAMELPGKIPTIGEAPSSEFPTKTGEYKAIPAGDWPGGGPPSARDRVEREEKAKAEAAKTLPGAVATGVGNEQPPVEDQPRTKAAPTIQPIRDPNEGIAGNSSSNSNNNNRSSSNNNWEDARFGSGGVNNNNNSNYNSLEYSSPSNRGGGSPYQGESSSYFQEFSGGAARRSISPGAAMYRGQSSSLSPTAIRMDPRCTSEFSRKFLEGLDAGSRVPIVEEDPLQTALDATMQLLRKETAISRHYGQEDELPIGPASVAYLLGGPIGSAPMNNTVPSSPSSLLPGETDEPLPIGALSSQRSLRSRGVSPTGSAKAAAKGGKQAASSLSRAASQSLSPRQPAGKALSTSAKQVQRAKSAAAALSGTGSGPGAGPKSPGAGSKSPGTGSGPAQNALQSKLQSQLEAAQAQQTMKRGQSSRSTSPLAPTIELKQTKRATLKLDEPIAMERGSIAPEASMKGLQSSLSRRSAATAGSRASQSASPSPSRLGVSMSGLKSVGSRGSLVGGEGAGLNEEEDDDDQRVSALTSSGSGLNKVSKGKMSISKITKLTKWAIKAKAAAAATSTDVEPRKSVQSERRSFAMTAEMSQLSQVSGRRLSAASGLGENNAMTDRISGGDLAAKAQHPRLSRLSMVRDNMGEEPSIASDDECSTQRDIGENKWLPVSLVLVGFSRPQLNGRYWQHNGMKDMLNDKEIYLSESNKNALLYYCRSQNDWRITNARASALKGMGLARACKGVDILNASVGSDWQEWDKDVGKWIKRPHAGVQEMEVHSDVSFRLEETDRQELVDDKDTLYKLYEALRYAVGDEAQIDEDAEDIEVTVDLESGKVQARVVPLDLSKLRSGQMLERISTHFSAFREEVRGAVQMALRGTELSSKLLKKEAEEQAAAAEAAKKTAEEKQLQQQQSYGDFGASLFGLSSNATVKAPPPPPASAPPARTEPLPADIKLLDFHVGHRADWLMQLSSINPLSEGVVAEACPPSPRTLQTTRPSSLASLHAEVGFQNSLKLRQSLSTPTLRGIPGMPVGRGRGWAPQHSPQSRSVSPGNCSTCTSLGNSSVLPGGASSSLSVFKAFLLTRLTSFAVAWRTLLDPSHTGYLLRRDFFKLSRQLHFHGNMKDVWEEMDADNLGRVRLDNLDFDTASLLGKFLSVLESRYGSLGEATDALGLSGNRRLTREEFMQKLQGSVLAGRDTSLRLFDMLAESLRYERSGTARKQAAVTSSSLLWLGKIGPWLPKPAQRVRPGVAEGLNDYEEEEDRIIGMHSDSEDSVHGGVCGGSEIAPRSRRHGKDVFQDLSEQAIGYHCRRDMLERQSKKKVGQVPKGRIQNPEHIEWLHCDHSRRIAKQTVLTEHLENSLRTLRRRGEHGHDPEIFERLITPRPDIPAKGLGGKDLSSSTFKPVPSQKKSAEEIEKEVARLYRDAALRRTRHDELVALRTKQAEEELAAKQPKPRHTDGTVNKAQMVRRLHDLEVTRRQQKDLGRHQEAQKAEDEIVAQASSVWLSSPNKSPDSTPRRARSTESAHRLHLDSYVRKEKVTRKRKAKKDDERQMLEENSIHQWSPFHTGDVFKRLFTSYGRHIGPDGIDRTRWGQDSTWQEPLQPDHPDYLPDDGPWNDKTRANVRSRPSTAYAGIRYLCGPRLDDPEATPFEEVVHPDVAAFARAKAGCIRGARDRRVRDAMEEEEERERERDEATEKSLSRLTFKSPIMSRRTSFQITESENSPPESLGDVEELTEFTLIGDTLTIGTGSDIHTSQSTLGIPHPTSALGHTSSMSTIGTTGTSTGAGGNARKVGKPAGPPAGMTAPVSALRGGRAGRR